MKLRRGALVLLLGAAGGIFAVESPLHAQDARLGVPNARSEIPSLSQQAHSTPLTTESDTTLHTGWFKEGLEKVEHRVMQLVDDLPAPAQNLPAPAYENAGPLGNKRPKPFTVDWIFMGRSGMEPPTTAVKINEVGITYQHRFPIGQRFLLTTRPFGDVMFLAGPGGPVIVLPPQLYKIGIDLQGDFQINDFLGISLGLTPGLWTDFADFEGRDFRLPARLLGSYRHTEKFFFAAGLYYSANIRRNLFPVAGIIWLPADRWRLELMWPRSRLVYYLHEEWEIYGVFEGRGDTYAITTNGQNDQVFYRDLKFLLGTSVDFWNPASIFVETGVAFAREFQFDIQPNSDINACFVLRLGVRF